MNEDYSFSGLQLPDGITYTGKGNHGPRYRVSDPETLNPQLLKMFIRSGAQVRALQEIPRTLEQAYLAAMTRVKHA